MMTTDNRKLYVGNFPWATTEDVLRVMFEGYGDVRTIEIITDIDTGKSKGYAFIEMSTAHEAEAAMALNDAACGGRRLRVGYAKPKRSAS